MKTSIKTKILSLLLALSLVLSSGLCCVAADTQTSAYPNSTGIEKQTNEIARFNDYPVATYNVLYPSIGKYLDYYYSDGFFTQSALNKNTHLYTTSLMLAGAAASNSSNKTGRVINALKSLGFSNAMTNPDFSGEPTENTIGVATAYKHVENDADDMYIVPISIRGFGYETEWQGNAVIGSSGNAENFQAMSDKTVAFVQANVLDELANKGVKKEQIKIWITGYSRGAAVANLAAKTLTDTYGNDNVYAYCFETPQPAMNPTSGYENIRCVTNESDLVAVIPPSTFGFGVYGQNLLLNYNDFSKDAVNAEILKMDPNYEFDTEGFQEYTIKLDLSLAGIISLLSEGVKTEKTGRSTTQAQFNAQLLQYLTTDWGILKSRYYYANTVVENGDTQQNAIKVLLDIFNNTNRDYLGDGLLAAVKGLSTKEYYSLYSMLKNGADDVSWNSWNLLKENRKTLYDDLWTGFVNNDGTKGMTDAQKTAFKNSWYTICRIVIDIAHNDAADGDAVVIGTLIENIERIGQAHYAELPLAFIRTKDSYYGACTHSLKKTDAVLATTETAGNVAYWTCEKCGQYYTDENAYSEVSSGEWNVAQIDASSITLSKESFVYDETEHKPEVTVKDANGKTLKSGTDYTLSYSNNKALSTDEKPAKVTITFKGNYSGSVEKEFKILEGKTVTGRISGYAGTHDLTVTLMSGSTEVQKVTATKGDGFYSYKLENVEAGSYTLKVSAESVYDVDYVAHSYDIVVNDAVSQKMTIQLLGDSNMDGKRSAEDITALARHTAKIKTVTDPYNLLLLDTDRNKSVGDAADITHLARFVAKIIEKL